MGARVAEVVLRGWVGAGGAGAGGGAWGGVPGARGFRLASAALGRNSSGEARTHRSGGKGSTFAKYRRSGKAALNDSKVQRHAGVVPLLRLGRAEAEYPLPITRVWENRYGHRAMKHELAKWYAAQRRIEHDIVRPKRRVRHKEREEVEREAREIMELAGWVGPVPKSRRKDLSAGFDWELYDTAVSVAMEAKGYTRWGRESRFAGIECGKYWGLSGGTELENLAADAVEGIDLGEEDGEEELEYFERLEVERNATPRRGDTVDTVGDTVGDT